MAVAIVVVVGLVLPFPVGLARQRWRDRQHARLAAGGVEVHAVLSSFNGVDLPAPLSPSNRVGLPTGAGHDSCERTSRRLTTPQR